MRCGLWPRGSRSACATLPPPGPGSTCWSPWGGYLLLAERLSADPSLATAFNFGPQLEANRSVRELVEEALRHWPGRWIDQSDPSAPHEAGLLHLVIDKAHHQLGWAPRWDFASTLERTVRWYRQLEERKATALDNCLADLVSFQQATT